MSATNRLTSRWSSSMKSNSSNRQSSALLTVQRKPLRSAIHYQPSFTQRMAKTRHDVEQLFKLYYSTNVKFDTFQRQVVTGTRIPSAPTSILTRDHFMRSTSNVFRSKHCVSREDEGPTNIDEHLIINDDSETLPSKRTVEVRIDHHRSISPSSDVDLQTLENPSLSTELNESTLLKSIEDLSIDSSDDNRPKTRKSIASASTLPLLHRRKDPLNASHSSLSTMNSNQTHIITGSAVIVRERSALNKQRIQSTSQHTNFKTSSVSIQYSQPGLPMNLGTRVVSIPSKCSRYVLVTLPQVPVRYNAPTYVERLLLPDRFPALFQNIVHQRNHK